MKTAILTRFCYSELLNKKRLELFQENFIDSLKVQTDQDFDIFVICDNHLGKKAHPKNLAKIKKLDFNGLNVYFTDVKKHTYDIEIRMDSDDYVTEDFIEVIHKIAETEDNILLNFKPIKDIDGNYYKHETDYNDNCASMFLALIQKGKKTKGVHDRPHNHMAKHVGKVLTIDEGYCFLNIHDDNMTSKALGNEVLYEHNEYWEDRYATGGNSGNGSYGILADYKAEVINEFIKENNITSLVEYGCGDGNQLSLIKCKNITGVDISETALNLCRKLIKGNFYNDFKKVKEVPELVLSLDVIYHLVNEVDYKVYMNNLLSSGSKYLIIYSANEVYNNLAPHVKSRVFTKDIKGYKLIKKLINPHKSMNHKKGSFADFYIYEKK